eukprot:144974-Pleurochrysis_carterae.AAC.2
MGDDCFRAGSSARILAFACVCVCVCVLTRPRRVRVNLRPQLADDINVARRRQVERPGTCAKAGLARARVWRPDTACAQPRLTHVVWTHAHARAR